MILRFGFTNFTSFKESVEIDFRFDGKTPKSISNSQKASPVLGIKGANGSGKTNILRALAFLSSFCSYGARTPHKKEGLNSPHRIAADSFFGSKEPTEFFIEFLINNIEYSYELEIIDGKISKEVISKKEKSFKTIIERHNNEIKFRQPNYQDFDNFELSEDKSIIEMIGQFKFKHDIEELERISMFFIQMIINVNYDGFYDFDLGLSNESELLYNKPNRFNFVKEIIKASDPSVIDIEIKIYKDSNGDDIYTPIFKHRAGNGENFLPFSKQSMGTQKLYMVLSAYFLVITSGGVLALDEFDIHLHALILPLLVNLFTNPEINKTGAQFIFTSHNTEIIDVLGKYRVYLVNKEEGESYGYRLDEIPGSMVRNDRPITPLYISGKLGGVPESVNINIESIIDDELQHG
ncbi:AAA family ATPase [Vibrio vulnificus]|nr:AAA family ATPase [Vibrio vulnificus]HAS8329530.1 hypothetical protein [Vibrio vulnificus]